MSEENLQNLENGQDLITATVQDREQVFEDGDTAVEILKRNPTTIEDVDSFRASAFTCTNAWAKVEHWLKDVLKEDEANYEQKFGLGLAALGLYEQAEPLLEKIQDLPVAACLLGRIYMETGREKLAVKIFKQIHNRVPEVKRYQTLLAEALEAAEDLDGFQRELEKIESTSPEDGDTFYLKGLSAERSGEYEETVSLYRQALELNPNHGRAAFRLAYRLDLEGRDEDAKEAYQNCIKSGVPNVAALMNLGQLYDDEEKYGEACGCFELVTKLYPTNDRAKIYLRDARASLTMYYDEEKERKEDKQAQILRIPVTDFELSVRSRNCLSKMNIKTLGDLIKKTEAELLAFKNFGETSLQEIKGILNSKGLRLGMMLTESDDLSNLMEPVNSDTDQDSVLNKPLEELDLSVRSRNCLVFLQIKTLGQLADCTEQQLMSCKNFGQTSLNEIRKKLGDFGLSLKV